MKRVASLVSATMLLAISVWGQTPTGIAQGTVTDATGGLVAAASVTLKNVDTNESRDLRTDSNGHYIVPFLTPGIYSMTAQASGFRTVTQENVKIDIGQNRSVDFSLQVGEVSERVEVQAAATPLDTNNATLGQVIDRAKVIDLPLNGRNPFSVATLVPGVNDVGGASTPHIGGSRNAVNEQQLDGVSNILPREQRWQ